MTLLTSSSLVSLRGSTAQCIMVCHQEINQMLQWWHHLSVCLPGDGEMGRRIGNKWGNWGVEKDGETWTETVVGERKGGIWYIHKPWKSKFNPLCLHSLFSPVYTHWIIKHSQFALTGCLLSEHSCLVYGWAFQLNAAYFCVFVLWSYRYVMFSFFLVSPKRLLWFGFLQFTINCNLVWGKHI